MASKKDYVFRYRVNNWRAYNRALVARGRITFWFDEDAISAWRHREPQSGPGTPKVYSDTAIECAVVLKSVYHLPLRATQGLLCSLVELMELELPVPDYSTVSRRQSNLSVAMPVADRARHVVVDSTGLKVYGAGEWHAEKHGVNARRTWRKLHLGVDEMTKDIVAVEVTPSNIHDSLVLPNLLEQVPGPLRQVSGDGAYDTRSCYEAVLERGAEPAFAPRKNARQAEPSDGARWRVARDAALRRIKANGRYVWRIESGCTRQAIAENAMYRFKVLFGPALRARRLDSQSVEARAKCAVMNRMTLLGMPKSERVA